MLDIIIALLMAFGIDLDRESAFVSFEKTGEVFGVGNNNTGGNSIVEPKKFILLVNDRSIVLLL